MGWYFEYGASRADVIRRLTAPQKNEETGWERKPLKFSTAGNVLWVVWEITCPNGDKVRHIGCDLLRPSKDGWGYKPMDEDMEPCYYSCPLSYLDMVPGGRPEWRAKVRAYWEQRKARSVERRARKARWLTASQV